MTKVKEKSTYAVVDIETTGGNVANGDRIIQFGCVLIEEDRIVQQFAVDINPLVNIPKKIELLTGITNQAIANAPYFEDVAPTLFNLLEGCIFVAHNIQFDYGFLNEEFKRCGMPSLRNKGIDTVELAQIILPTEPSFRLNDLAATFKFSHQNPHQADSDAYVTAELFLALKKKLKQFPLITIEKLIELAEHCTMNTNLFFKDTLSEMRDEHPLLPETILVKKGLALRKKQVDIEQNSHRVQSVYPINPIDKEALFLNHLTIRTLQNTLMDEVYQYFFESRSGHFAIEAATGIGKTLGYLVPLSYLATPDNPVIISTYTTLLQKQLIEKDIVQLNSILPFTVHAAIVKSKHHYLHLSKFKEVLNEPHENLTDTLLKMRTLTWLTQTVTGDIDELNLTNYLQPFWEKVRHRGWADDYSQDPFSEQDFYLHAKEQIKHASMIITNHAFLFHDLKREKPILPDSKRIILDEAHHLPDVAAEAASDSFSYYANQKLLKKIGKLSDDKSMISQLNQLNLKIKTINPSQLRLVEMSVLTLEEALSDFFEAILLYTQQELMETTSVADQVDLPFIKTENWSLELKKLTKKISTVLNDLVFFGYDIIHQTSSQRESFTYLERYLLDDFLELLTKIEEQKNSFSRLFQKTNQNELIWFSFKQKNPKNSFMIKQSVMDSSLFIKKYLIEKKESILYIGATLSIDSDFTYFENQLGESDLRKLSIATPYDYKNQARIFIPADLKPIKQLSKEHYAKMVVDYLELIALTTNENILVLFTANETLQDVYNLLQQQPSLLGRELLAQGISGSRDRMLKRFFHATGGILLGADSFWEGVDLPGKSLKVIVVTRLPFEPPERPLVKAKYRWLEEQGLNPFIVDALPKATLRMKQGLGRLIRSEEDKGIMVVLDDRLVKASYGNKIMNALPDKLTKEIVSREELKNKIALFLSE
ncbi:ATP-dependent DNA helicase DinG [Carnobacterium sp. TMP28]|uniref:ATP-dependent DNA helicase DinG n=1 Tax=Carnobacterium sp. TMP28 TaxID=3397060 RepID=UPI0039E0AE78